MQQRLIDGRYNLGELLGGGGMAEVHLARDEVLGRDVALKVLRSQYANDEEFVERFRREAKSAAALNHPNIVQVYDQGSADDGTNYIAMECVPGGTLADRIKREGPFDPGEAARIASRVAEALAVAHERGIIHRDIKPQNVLLTATGDAKVADFGIARAASAKTITETRLVLGTAAYMSPEQVRGERAGPGSDLYSLGVVLFEMLTGEPPYTADNPLATAMKHTEEPPRHPRDVNPAVPEDLDAITTKLLAKDPEDRYTDATELAEDLRRVSNGLPPLGVVPIQQATARIPQDTGKTRVAPAPVPPGGGRSRRRRLLPLAVLLLGLALLGGLAWAVSSGLLGQDPPGAGGAQRVEVPEVVGLSVDEARVSLERAGLELGSQTQAVSEDVPNGDVIQQDPAAGGEAERGSAVDVVVSTGPPAATPDTQSPSATPSASPTAPATSTPPFSTPASAAGEEAREAQREANQEAREAQQRQREAARDRAQDQRGGED